MSDLVPVKRALISVSDKSDLIPLARRLARHGVQVISTGGTAKAIQDAGIPVTPVHEVTEFPEMMDGRVKTLHPRIHGGLLALRDHVEHVAAMRQHGIEQIDLVCVNLYPFEKTVAHAAVKDEEAIEQIDIGGPSMIRSGAKNHRFVTVVTDPGQYDQLCHNMDLHEGATTLELRQRFAAAAFARTAAYDTAIAEWMIRRFQSGDNQRFSETMILRFNRASVLRYGENPHQGGCLYADPRTGEASVTNARQLHGKELSFNNLYDAGGALELVKEVDAAAAAVIKHANPCGFAAAADLRTAFDRAYAGDPLAAFGGIIAMNRIVDLATAEALVEGKKFLEVIVAPGYQPEALELLKSRWQNVRILETAPLPKPDQRDPAERDFKRIVGGLLVQERDLAPIDPRRWEHKAGPTPDAAVIEDMRLATIAVKHLKSNAVCLVRDGALVGAGAGQMDRVASCRIALDKAGNRARGASVGSDAFFPFRDGPDLLIKAGIQAIAQPGGSTRDAETIAACQEAKVTLMFTGQRHFRH